MPRSIALMIRISQTVAARPPSPRGLEERPTSFIIANNKAEGSAPLTLIELAKAIVA